MDLPDILSEENVPKAAKILHRYYLGRDEKTGLLSTGSAFDEWAGRGDTPKDRDRITDSDIVAVSMLSVTVPAKAAIGLSDPEVAKEITRLLALIPTDTRMSDLTPETARANLDKGSPAWDLWHILRADGRWDVGPTIASKLMARKRPHLIPIWDDIIGQVIGKRGPRNQWLNWHTLLTSKNDDLPCRLHRIHEQSGVTQELSELRIMDAILWRHGRDLGYTGSRGRRQQSREILAESR
jgi:hypothetical protein